MQYGTLLKAREAAMEEITIPTGKGGEVAQG